MNGNLRLLSLAVGVVSTAFYVICYLILAVLPGPTMSFFSAILHEDISMIHPLLDWGTFLIGLVFWFVGPAVYVALVVWVLHLFQPK
jgi:hypothetical protein